MDGIMDGDTYEQRAHERNMLGLQAKIFVNEKREERLKNISLGGLCFHSAEPMDVGNEISVGNRLMRINASVMHCEKVVSPMDASAPEGHEIRCRYIPTRDNLQEQMLMELVMAEIGGGGSADSSSAA